MPLAATYDVGTIAHGDRWFGMDAFAKPALTVDTPVQIRGANGAVIAVQEQSVAVILHGLIEMWRQADFRYNTGRQAWQSSRAGCGRTT
jgi:hypothetical protein